MRKQISGGSYEHVAFLRDDDNEVPASTTGHTKQREAVFAGIASQAKTVAVEASKAAGHDQAPAIICTGGFRNEAMIASAMENGIDLVGIGRVSAADPDFVARLVGEPEQVATSATDASKDDHGVSCRPYRMRGGGWLSGLVQLKVIGAGVSTLWHQSQMKRISRGEDPDLDAFFERLMLAELLPCWLSLRILALSIVFAASVFTRL